MGNNLRLKIFFSVAALLIMSGCNQGIDAQVEKCVAAYIASNPSEQFKGRLSKEEAEAKGRVICLRAASGARN